MTWRAYGAKFALTLLVGCAVALCLEAPPLRAGAGSTQRFDRGLLWKVEASGAPPSFLFGTIHINDKRVTNLPQAVRMSLESSNSFTMEVELDPNALLELATRMLYDDGRNLESVIGAPLYKRVGAASAGLGIPGELLRQFKPWAIALMLVVPQQTTGEVLDFKLYGIALKMKKVVYQLETVDEQVETLDGLSDSDQLAMLREALDNHGRMPEITKRLVEAYLRRDLAEMSRINDESDENALEYRAVNRRLTQRLLDERNLRMVNRMQPQLEAGGAFIAVGALHLYGEHGLLSLLSKRGYQIERVY